MNAVRLHQPGRRVEVTVDGVCLSLPEGEMLAVALACEGIRLLRHSPREGGARGAFCFMGTCQECVVQVDGVLRQACMTPVSPGLAISLGGAP
jgi:D-hydroxyproline dehydrogenase subunit gamma